MPAAARTPDRRHRRPRRQRSRPRGRRALLATVATAVALCQSGCVIIESESSRQLSVVGDVEIATTICASDTNSNNAGYTTPNATCQGPGSGGNSGLDATSATGVQVLIAYRIPSAVDAPPSFTTSNPAGLLTFTANPGFASDLQAKAPAPPGEKWVGYVSGPANYSPSSPPQEITVTPRFALRQGPDGSPFQGPFTYRTIVGFRSQTDASGATAPDRAVVCGSPIDQAAPDGTRCDDSPSLATVASDVQQATRDLGVVAGSATVHAGSTASVPFTLKYRGASDPQATFALAGSTDVPGATASLSRSTLAPATDSDNAVTASVAVPASTSPGTYRVTLTASLANGQTRTGTATLTVRPAFAFHAAPALPPLPPVTLNGRAQTVTAALPSFSVNDTSGVAAGWSVTVAGDTSAGHSPQFRQYCPNPGGCGPDPFGYVSGGASLPAGSLTLDSSGATWSGGDGAAPSFQCGSGCAVDSPSPSKIASAPAVGGTGLWTADGFGSSSVSLAVPAGLSALPSGERYRLDVVWTLSTGP